MNILITGVSQGLGLETLSIALEAGHSVYGISRSKSQDLEAMENKYTDHFFWESVDLMMEENIQKVIFKSFIGTKTPIHGIVNNAAIAYDDLVTNLSSKSVFGYNQELINSQLVITECCHDNGYKRHRQARSCQAKVADGTAGATVGSGQHGGD